MQERPVCRNHRVNTALGRIGDHLGQLIVNGGLALIPQCDDFYISADVIENELEILKCHHAEITFQFTGADWTQWTTQIAAANGLNHDADGIAPHQRSFDDVRQRIAAREGGQISQ